MHISNVKKPIKRPEHASPRYCRTAFPNKWNKRKNQPTRITLSRSKTGRHNHFVHTNHPLCGQHLSNHVPHDPPWCGQQTHSVHTRLESLQAARSARVTFSRGQPQDGDECSPNDTRCGPTKEDKLMRMAHRLAAVLSIQIAGQGQNWASWLLVLLGPRRQPVFRLGSTSFLRTPYMPQSKNKNILQDSKEA